MADIHDHVIIEQALRQLGLVPEEGDVPPIIIGEANDGANVGLGEGQVYRDKTGVTLNFRTLKAGANINISTVDDIINIDASGAGMGNVTGPDPSTLNAIATYGTTDGTVLLDTKIRITSPTNIHLMEIDNPTTPGTWYEALQVFYTPANGLPAGHYLQLGGTDIPTIVESAGNPYVRTATNLGKMIHEHVGDNWVINGYGRVTHALGDTNHVLRLSNTGTSPGSCEIYVGNRDPNGVVTGNPGDIYIRTNSGVASSLYQHQGFSPSTVWTEFGGPISADQVSINTVGSPVYDQVQEAIDQFGMAGSSSTGYITDSGGLQIDVASGVGFIRTSDSHNAPLVGFNWTALLNQSIPADTIRYVGVVYNAGSPQVEIHTSDDFDGHDTFRLGSVVNQNSTLHILNNPQQASDFGEATYHRFFDALPIQRADRIGGIIPADIGTRNYSVSAGVLYDGFNDYTVAAIDTSGSDTFDAYYRDGVGGWTRQAAQTQWNNTQYDDGSGTLQSISANRYGIHWLYIETDGQLVTLYGQGNYLNVAAAEAANPPATVPLRIQAHGRLLGRLIFEQASATAYSVDNVWDAQFSVTPGSGDVVGPSSAGASAICRFDGTTGKLIQNSDMRIRHLSSQIVQDINDPSGASWLEALSAENYAANGIPAGTYVTLGGTSNGTIVKSNGGLYATTPSGTGKIIHEGVGLGWEVANWGRISTPSADTQEPLSLASYGTNGSTAALHVGNRSPAGAVSATPGAIYIRSNGTSSALYQHRGSGSGTSGWASVDANRLNVGFYAYRSSGSQSLSTGVETKVQFPAERDDTGNDFDAATTYVFTAPTAGRYAFSSSAQITLAATGYAELRLYSSTHGLISEGRDTVPAAGTCKPNVSTQVLMDASETMEVRAFQVSGSTSTIQASGLNFSGAQISEV